MMVNQPVPTARAQRKMYSEVVRVTPEIAVKWLEGNVHNRDIRDSVVTKYAEDMKAGRWGLTHQGLAFTGEKDDPRSKLIDGQHRLYAIVEAEVAVFMTVTWNVPEESQEYIDGGIPRTAVDVLKLANPDAKATPFRMAIARQMLTGVRTQSVISRQELIEFYQAQIKAIAFVVDDAFQGRKVLRANPAPVAAVMGRAYYHEDHDRIREFGRITLDGLVVDPETDNAAILLRNWLLTGSQTFEKAQRISRNVFQYMKAQRALVAFLAKEKLKTLYPYRDEHWTLPGERVRRGVSKSGKKKSA